MKIGFIGGGKMAEAIFAGAISNGIMKSSDVFICEPNTARAFELTKKYTVQIINFDEIASCDIAFLCVKPQVAPQILKNYPKNVPLISIAAALSTAELKKYADYYLRVMPNTPLIIGRGVSVLFTRNNLSDIQYGFIKKLFSSLGEVFELSEKQVDIITAISGSGPVYAYLICDAIAKAGQNRGLEYEIGLKLAANTVSGASTMISKADKTIEHHINDVCSPGGLTIETVQTIEQSNFYEIIDESVEQNIRKAKILAGGAK